MKLLITGASGLLGLNLALETHRAHQVTGVVHRTRLQGAPFPVLQADLTQPGAVARLFAEVKPDWVIHTAALANLEDCERNPDLAQRLNTEVPAILARACRKGGARLLHVSTDAVFDGTQGNYTETDPPNPLSVYAQTKLAGEQAVLAEDAAAIVARVNLFGFSPTGKRSLAEFFLYNLLVGHSVKGFTDVFFCPLLVNRIAEIFVEMLQKDLHGLYHVFAAECVSKYDFGVRIARLFGLDEHLIAPISVQDFGLLAQRAPDLRMNTHKLSTALGHALPTLSPMLTRFYTLYQQGYPQKLKKMVSIPKIDR